MPGDVTPLLERRGVLHRLAWFKERPAARRAILAVDLVGVLYGFFYYSQFGQFALTPPWLWPVVPDSPLAVLFAFAALLVLETGRRVPWLDALAFVGNVKIGLWTGYVLVRHAGSFGTFEPGSLNGVLLVAHLAMVGHALLFAHDLRGDWARGARVFVVPATAYYLLNDAFDYLWRGVVYPGNAGCPGTRPITVPCAPDDAVLAAVTLGITVLSVLWLLALVRGQGARSAR